MFKKTLAALTLGLFVAFFAPSASLSVQAAEQLTANNFDSVRYANENPDLKAAFGYDHYALWNHYMTYGAGERRAVYTKNNAQGYLPSAALSSETFDSTRYANEYADLKAAYGYNHAALWNHYIAFGRTENRKAYTVTGKNATAQAVQPSMEQQFSQLVLGALNAQRAAAGASPIALASDAESAARVRGQDFLAFWNAGVNITATSHIRPDGQPFTSAYAVRPYAKYGENVAFAYWHSSDDVASFAAQVVNTLGSNSTHYLNTIDKDFTAVGIYPMYIKTYGSDIYYIVVVEYHS